MTQSTNNKPDIVQAFDYYEDRVYYKIIPGFFFNSTVEIRADRMKKWKQWQIECEDMPDKIVVNGKEYKLVDNTK